MLLNKSSLFSQFVFKIIVTLAILSACFLSILGGVVYFLESNDLNEVFEDKYYQSFVENFSKDFQGSEYNEFWVYLTLEDMFMCIKNAELEVIVQSQGIEDINLNDYQILKDKIVNQNSVFYVELYTDKNEVVEEVLLILEIAIIAMLILAFFAIPIIWILGKKLADPIIKLSEQLVDKHSANLAEPIVLLDQQDNEIGVLVTEINLFHQKLSASFNHLNAFANYLSHEIKTPLSVLASYLDQIDDVELKSRFSNNIAFIVTIINDLKLFHLLKENRYPLETASYRLNFIFKKIVASYFPKKLDLDCQYQDCKTVCLDSDLVGILFRNVLENAIKYRSSSQCVTVFVSGRTVQVTHITSNAHFSNFEKYGESAINNTDMPKEHIGVFLIQSIVDVLAIEWSYSFNEGVLSQSFIFPSQ